MIDRRNNIVRSEIAMDIATEMQSGYFRAEFVQDPAAQHHIYVTRRVHPSCQNEAGRFAHDVHFIAGVAILSDEENAGNSKIVPAQIFGDLQNMIGALRTRFCLRACNDAAPSIMLLYEN